MRNKIPRSMLAGMNLQYKWYSPEYFLDSMAELGFESIALWGGPPHFYCDHLRYQDCAPLLEKIRERGLALTGFLVTASSVYYQPSAEEPEEIERSYRYFANGLRACAELGVPCMTICSGCGYFDHDREEATKRCVDMMHRLCETAETCGVDLGIETLKPSETQICVTMADLQALLAAVDHPRCKVIADTGALAENGETLEQWFEAFGDRIAGMHFVDRGHNVWGEGGSPLDSMIAAICRHDFKGPLMLETSVRRYMDDPRGADRRALRILERFVEQ